MSVESMQEPVGHIMEQPLERTDTDSAQMAARIALIAANAVPPANGIEGAFTSVDGLGQQIAVTSKKDEWIFYRPVKDQPQE